jgi:hypothetical protein
LSSELYDVLCTAWKGEALLVLKSVDEFEGFRAWQKLWSRYIPKTSGLEVVDRSVLARFGEECPRS